MADADDTLLDADEVCVFLGGKNAPIHRTTLYRGIRDGRFPPPIKFGSGTSRWSLKELLATREAAMQSRPVYKREAA